VTSRAANGFERQIIVQQALFLHRTLPVLVTYTFFAGLFTSYVLWDALERRLLAGWMASVALLTIVRLMRWRRVAAGMLMVDPGRARLWLREMQAGALGSGLLWGGLAVAVMLMAEPGLRATMLLAGVFLTVASCFSYGARFSVFLLFFLPALLPEAPALYLLGDSMDQGLAGGLTLFIVVMVVSGWRFNTLFVQHLLLGLKNAALAEQLRRERDAAELANLSKSRALATTGHDLRQPVHAIGLSISTVRRAAGLAPELGTLANHLEDCVDSLWRLLDMLADISRLNSKLVAVTRSELDLDAELRRAASVMEPAAAARGLTLRHVRTTLRVDADAKILNTVLLNLLGNAVRYTRKGRILVGCRRRGGKVEVQVCDTGIGFAPAETEAVFAEFARGRYVEGAASEGLGLGLAIVRQSLELLGETVRIVSTSSRGSILGFTLPIITASGSATTSDRGFHAAG
jgi:signal transduction histidine kinase